MIKPARINSSKLSFERTTDRRIGVQAPEYYRRVTKESALSPRGSRPGCGGRGRCTSGPLSCARDRRPAHREDFLKDYDGHPVPPADQPEVRGGRSRRFARPAPCMLTVVPTVSSERSKVSEETAQRGDGRGVELAGGGVDPVRAAGRQKSERRTGLPGLEAELGSAVGPE
jgi:hypothetical protein